MCKESKIFNNQPIPFTEEENQDGDELADEEMLYIDQPLLSNLYQLASQCIWNQMTFHYPSHTIQINIPPPKVA